MNVVDLDRPPPKPKGKGKRKRRDMFRYCVIELLDGNRGAWDAGQEFELEEGDTFTAVFNHYQEGIQLNGLWLPPSVKFIYPDAIVIKDDVGVFWIQREKPDCQILPTRGPLETY